MARKKSVKPLVPDLSNEDYYFNRELGWVAFNRRVLEEAEDPTHPLLERLKFLAIFSTNLDEFFMIRVAGLMEQIYSGVTELADDGSTPLEQSKEIRSQLLPLYKWQSQIFHKQVMPALEREGVMIVPFDTLSDHEKQEFEKDFVDNIMPVLTPLALDLGHPFPRLLNRSLNIAFVLNDDTGEERETRIAVLQLPTAFPRLVQLDRSGAQFVLLEQVIQAHAGILFPGLTLEESHVFRVTRDADVEIAEDEANDLITAVAEGIRQRRWGTDPVRLEIGPDMPRKLQQYLMKTLELEPRDVYSTDVPLNLQDFLSLMSLDKRRLKDTPFLSRQYPEFTTDNVSIFEALKERDIMVHHPFDSFTNSVVRFITQGANDPQVVAIKITLYRAGGSSPVIEALKRAAINGKAVTAFVELKARFDEENNIAWARELEQAGVHVVYGVLGLKTHCKVCLVIRKEGRKVLTYAHVSTGNYNLTTSRIYTDIGIFTGRQEFERDFVHFFNMLTGYSKHKDWEHIAVAPVNLRDAFIRLIRREAEQHTAERPGRIIAKMNALIDKDLIRELYAASQKGVRIDLIVRGVCALRPGIPGVSETITVRSILDRFLEHSRVYWFGNGGSPEVYISSADWMSRNMDRRVELLFPVYDHRIKRKLRDTLELYLDDNVKARELQNDGSYVRVTPAKGAELRRSQHELMRRS
jgi:polyphosphate kinase